MSTDAPPAKICLADHLSPVHLPAPLKGLSAVYYINMDRSTDRDAHMRQVFEDPIFQGIPVERVKGIDGKQDQVLDYLDFHMCSKNPRMMDTEYGCTLSHFRAIHQFAMTDDPIGLIVEDDLSTEFVPFWQKTVEEVVAGAPPDWEVLQLSYILFDTLPSEGYNLWEMHKNFCGTAAYLIRNEAAKRLIQYLCRHSSPVMPKYSLGPEVPYYHHADRFLYIFLKTYSYAPPLFTYRDNNDSTIHPDHVDFHSESKEKTKKLYLRYA
jgi:GR25 family glycosyltransferase involved in LPS biosynthesis